MSENGFEIVNGILKAYDGPNVSTLIIPEGVVETEEYALKGRNLEGCKKIVFPTTLRRVGRSSPYVYHGKTLEELEFLGDVERIGENAFRNGGLKRIVFHGSVGEIEEFAFSTNNIDKLVFSNVKKIGINAFSWCEELKEVHIEKIDSIAKGAFYECKNIEILNIPESMTNIGDYAFFHCEKLKKDGILLINGVLFDDGGKGSIPEGTIKITKRACQGHITKLPDTVRVINEQLNNVSFEKPSSVMLKTSDKLGGKNFIKHLDKWELDISEWAALYLFQSGKAYDKLFAKHIKSNFNDYVEEMITLVSEKGKAKQFQKTAEFILMHLPEIEKATIKKFYNLTIEKKQTKFGDMVKGCILENDENDMFLPYKQAYSEYLLDKSIKSNKGDEKLFAKVRLSESEEIAPAFIVKCAIVPYLDLYTGRPKHIRWYRTDYYDVKIIELADKAAGLLNICDVQALLEKEYAKGGSAWLLPYGRYASATQISAIISKMRKWEDWYTYGTTGRTDIITARGALMLSETREAMMNIDKKGLLEDYAKLRGTDADSIRDSGLAEFGLDASGKKEYDLGSKKVIVSLGQDLTLVIYDTAEDKIVKSIPKKGTDPVLVEKAAADFAEMKKNAKKVVKGRNDMLFEYFLSGKVIPAKSWIASYTKNPLLRSVAELIVWNQGKSTFILTSDGVIDCNGNAYEINDKTAIGVAHPIEMKKTEIEAWQKYFTSKGLKQPFSQIWEPVIDKGSIEVDRYKDCLIPFYRFRSQGKHGIMVDDNDFHNEIYIYFDGCDVDVERIDWHKHQINNDDNFEIRSFRFRKYTRQVNHIVAYLDRVTVSGRILKDDASISVYLDGFTLAQITEFIDLAMENNCTNCLAVLMDYKNNKYSTYDSMDAFTLE